jgi:hypothetical protein
LKRGVLNGFGPRGWQEVSSALLDGLGDLPAHGYGQAKRRPRAEGPDRFAFAALDIQG